MASSTTILFTCIAGGQQVSFSALGTTAQAANTYLYQAKNQEALATDPQDLVVKRAITIVDAVASNVAGTPTGVIQLMKDGDQLPIFINLASHKLDNAGRPKMAIVMQPGIYRWKITTAISAG